MKLRLRQLFPSLSFPETTGTTLVEKSAFWLGTGLGIGFVKPASATWGSLLGMSCLWCWSRLPNLPLAVAVEVLAIVVAVGAATVCERLLGQKDPHPVVIDEIVALPLAFWPLLAAHEIRWSVWAVAFCLYRLADVVKPWPARLAETLPRGWGIVTDDLVSATYTGLVILAWQRWF